MTDWTPRAETSGKPRYIAIADAIEKDVRDGRLSPGTRLPPQRMLAKQLGIDFTTVSRGYSEAQIDAYINDDVEKEKMRQRRNAYFEARGASNLDAESLCVLGRAEMSRKSRIGQLLRAK